MEGHDYMKMIYVSTVIIMVIAMLAMGQRTRRKNTDLAKSLVRLTFSVTITVVSSILAMVVESESLALIMQTIHYASTEWTLIFLMAFLERYTGRYEGTVLTRLIIFVMSSVCSLILFSNAIWGQVVSCENVMVGGIEYRVFQTYAPWYELHEYFSYLIAVCCLLTLVWTTIKTIPFYRVKYVPAIIALCITIAIEVACSIRDAKMDFALFGYIWLAMFLIYHSVYHEYKGLITSTLSYVTSDSHNGVICYSLDGKCIYVNEIIWKIYSDKKELADFDEIIKNYVKDEPHNHIGEKWVYVQGEDAGRKFYDIMLGQITDKRDDCIGYYLNVHDKTEEVREFEKERYIATHDVLTNLYNESEFNRLVDKRVKNGAKETYIIAVDIKDFKLINDLYGYDKGDEILKGFAKEMESVLSKDALCCRHNGDRFCIYIPKAEFDEEKLLASVRKLTRIIGDEDYQLIFHFGIFEVAMSGYRTSVMYDCARIALRTIKDDYDRFFAYYDAKMMEGLVREKELVSEFEKAVEEKQFKMFLQPQIRSNGEVHGAEALVRWEHPVEGMISPGEFIPTFEKSGMIHKLDMYMWEEAAAKIAEWNRAGNDDFYISVNISPIDFRYIDVYKTVVGIVEKYKIQANKLKLEITESVFMNDPEKQLELIDRLQQYGFIVEIDDFGSGYSSLNMLKDLKANVLKIDMGFLRKTNEKARAQVILGMIISLAKKLHMTVICEGVETQEQVDFLKEEGCDVFQGYYFDRPISLGSFEEKYMS